MEVGSYRIQGKLRNCGSFQIYSLEFLRFSSRKLSADFSKLRVTIRPVEENSFFEIEIAKKHVLFPLNIAYYLVLQDGFANRNLGKSYYQKFLINLNFMFFFKFSDVNWRRNVRRRFVCARKWLASRSSRWERWIELEFLKVIDWYFNSTLSTCQNPLIMRHLW